MSQRFIEFVVMHAQNAALFLGQIPNPKTGEGEVNLDLARMFIDQLAMIQEKTRGNLTSEETKVLSNALSNLQMAYVEVARTEPARPRPSNRRRLNRASPRQNRERNSLRATDRSSIRLRKNYSRAVFRRDFDVCVCNGTRHKDTVWGSHTWSSIPMRTNWNCG